MGVNVLFVCLGNICRSPLAEAAFRAEAEARGIDALVDSAGTGGWHRGDPPDPRSRAVAKRHGIDISTYRARQVIEADFTRFDHIVAMDAVNLRDLRGIAPVDATARLSLLLDHVAGREGQSVADPYYGADAAFDTTLNEAVAGAKGLAGATIRERDWIEIF